MRDKVNCFTCVKDSLEVLTSESESLKSVAFRIAPPGTFTSRSHAYSQILYRSRNHALTHVTNAAHASVYLFSAKTTLFE